MTEEFFTPLFQLRLQLFPGSFSAAAQMMDEKIPVMIQPQPVSPPPRLLHGGSKDFQQRHGQVIFLFLRALNLSGQALGLLHHGTPQVVILVNSPDLRHYFIQGGKTVAINKRLGIIFLLNQWIAPVERNGAGLETRDDFFRGVAPVPGILTSDGKFIRGFSTTLPFIQSSASLGRSQGVLFKCFPMAFTFL